MTSKQNIGSSLKLLEIEAKSYIQAITSMSKLSAMIEVIKEQRPDLDDGEIPANVKPKWRKHIKAIQEACVSLDANITKKFSDDLQKNFRKENYTFYAFGKDLEVIGKIMIEELSASKFYALDTKVSEYFANANDIFGDSVVEIFPHALTDIEEASKCLATSRNTAVVFHLMRAMEVMLRSMGRELSCKVEDKYERPLTWGVILSNLNAKIDKMDKGSKKMRWSNSHSLLTRVKDAWRNETMHPNQTYTDDQALEILKAVKGFSNSLTDLITAE